MLKRLLMTADTVGGVWTYALELARALGSQGVEVSLATMGRSLSESQQIESAAIENLHVYESNFKLEWMNDPWDDVRASGEWLLNLRDRIQPDIIHLNNYAHGALPWHLPVLMVGHSCVFSWWKAVHGTLPPHEWLRYYHEVSRGLASATRVVAPSRAMLASLQEIYGSFDSGEVIPNGRSAADFRAGIKRSLVLSAGRLWDAAKNVAALSEIAGQLRWPVFIAGDLGTNATNRVARSGVMHLGSLTSGELGRWMSQASIFALPAFYEPFGLTILEAALSGCALVLGDIDSLKENWSGAALFVNPADPKALQQRIEILIQNPGHLSALARQAHSRALQFTTNRMLSRYMETYETLCGSFCSAIR
jgi:glycogen(starch) synthase